MKRVVAALIFREGKILVCQRTRHQTMPLKWEFPGGKIEPGEQPRDALRRELEEELGIDASIGDEVARIRHEYKDWRGGRVALLQRCESTKAKSRTRFSRTCSWASAPSFRPSIFWKPILVWCRIWWMERSPKIRWRNSLTA